MGEGPHGTKRAYGGITVHEEPAYPAKPHPNEGYVGTYQGSVEGLVTDPDKCSLLYGPGDSLSMMGKLSSLRW